MEAVIKTTCKREDGKPERKKGLKRDGSRELKRHGKRDKAGWQGGMEWEWTRERAAIAKSGMKAEDESQHGKCGWIAVMKPAENRKLNATRFCSTSALVSEFGAAILCYNRGLL